MRTYNAEYQALNQRERKEPRFVLEIVCDTNTYYITSHADIVIPGVSSAYILQSSFIRSSVTSQTLNNLKASSDVGQMSFEILDADSAFTAMLAALEALDESLRGRKLRYYQGYKGQAFTPLTGGDYINLQVQEVHGNISNHGTAYGLQTRDVQRSLITKIFTPKTTTLMSSISRTDIVIPCQLVTDFETIVHTASFSDAPSATVGYIRIGDEVMRWTSKNAGTDEITIDNASTTLNGATTVGAISLVLTDASGFATSGAGYIDDSTNVSEIRWTGKSTNTLTGVSGIKYAHANGSTCVYSKGRGVMNTVAVAHEVDSGITDDDRKPKIEEFIYLELPALQAALTIMTGTIYGTANTIPDHWSALISSTWIATSTFENIGTDIYNPASATAGIIVRFEGLKTADAKTFVQEEIYKLIGVFDYIQGDGQIAIKRMNEPLPDSPYLRKLDDSQIAKDGITALTNDLDDVYNEFEILWNWNPITESFSRRLLLPDAASQTKHKLTRRLTLSFKGLHGSRHTDAVVYQLLDTWRSRHAGPPWKAEVKLKYLNSDLDVGDPVLLDTDFFRDHLGSDTTRFSRTVEVQRISADPVNGKLSIRVFGATERATPLNLGAQSAVLDASYYTASGTSLAAQTTYFTDVTGVLHCDTNGYTMTGATSINDTAAHYYVNGDLTIDADIGITFTQNCLLKVNGHLTINGYLTGAGQGIAGVAFSGTGSGGSAQAGTVGFYGVTQGGGGLTKYQWVTLNNAAPSAAATNKNPPRLLIVNNSGQLEIPVNDLRPSSGGSGRQSEFREYAQATVYADGGDGGAGGPVLVIVCKSMSFGGSGYIDTSGAAGTDGSTAAFDQVNGANDTKGTIAGGKGASGMPGAVYVLLDGNTATRPSNQLRAYYYSTEGPGTHLENGGHSGDLGLISSNLYNDTINMNQTCWIVQQIPDDQTAVEEPTGRATVSSAIVISPPTSTRNMVNANVYEITTTAPVGDTAWRADRVYWRTQGASDWTELGVTNGSNELLFYAGAGAGTVEFKAHPISTSNIESPDYIEATLTVSTSVTTTLGQNGMLLIGSATDYNTGAGVALKDDAGTAKAHMGNPAGQYWRWTGAAMQIKGDITADSISTISGSIGGWALSAGSIYYDGGVDGDIVLDATNERIRISDDPGTTYIEMSLATGLKGVDATLGTVFQVPMNGTKPSFPSGVTSTTITLNESNVFRTSSTVGDGTASSAGVIINDTGIKAYPASSSTPNIHLDASAGKLTLAGASNIALDTSTGAISINNSTFGNSGIQLQYNAAAPQMYIGNGEDDFIKYTNAAGFELGRDVKFDSGKSFLSSVIYYDGHINDHNPSTSASGSGEALTLSTRIRLSTSVSGDTASLELDRLNTFTTPTWSNNRRFRVKVEVLNLNGANAQAWVQTGTAGAGGSPTTGFGFKLYNGNIYGFSNNNGTTTTTASLDTYASGDELDLRADLTAGSTIEFYINGVLSGTTITTNYPTGTSSAGKFLNVLIEGLGTQTNRIYVGDFKVEQSA